MSTRENIRLIARAPLSSWCLVMVEWLFLAVPRGCLQFVIVVFSDHTHLLFLVFRQQTCNCKKGSDWFKGWVEAQHYI